MSETPKQNEQLANSIGGFLDKYGDKLWNGVKSVYKKASDETRLNGGSAMKIISKSRSTNIFTPKLFSAITSRFRFTTYTFRFRSLAVK